MIKKTLQFYNVEVNKKKFHASKRPIALGSVLIGKIVISDIFEYSDKDFKFYIGYKDDNIIRLQCVVLPEMGGYVKYFENRGRNMSFMIEEDSVLTKYNEIWNKIKKKLNIKFHSICAYDKKYMKTKVKEFNGVVNTNF